MKKEPTEDVRLTLRISAELYERIQKLARGNGRRPAIKINPMIVWLIERALEQSENESGPFVPADLVELVELAA